MPYKIKISKSAEKYINKLSKPQAHRIIIAIDQIAADPYHDGIEQLRNHEYTYRKRVGTIRILFDVYEDQILVFIGRIGPRGDVYN
jgi:mRNA interferase RelE/StbE